MHFARHVREVVRAVQQSSLTLPCVFAVASLSAASIGTMSEVSVTPSIQIDAPNSPLKFSTSSSWSVKTGSCSDAGKQFPLSFVVIGMTGHGKSSSANTISGTEVFSTSCNAKSETWSIKSHEFQFRGRQFRVIDMPGFLDTHHSLDDIQRQLALVANESGGKVVAIVVVLRRGRATPDVHKVATYVGQQFGAHVLHRHAILLFTDTFESGSTIWLDAQDLPKADVYRQFVLGMPRERVLALQNKVSWPSEWWNQFQQRQAVLSTLQLIYEQNTLAVDDAKAQTAFLQCEQFRKKILQDEEARKARELEQIKQELEKTKADKANAEAEVSTWRKKYKNSCTVM